MIVIIFSLGIDTRILTKELREHGTMLGKKPHVFNPTGKISMACVDCGLKNNQLRILCQLDAKVTVFPWNHPVKQDDILLKTGIAVYIFLPVFGISLGHQVKIL
ncbi:unnamed protein product, partial [Rotaria sp. Silwood1]